MTGMLSLSSFYSEDPTMNIPARRAARQYEKYVESLTALLADPSPRAKEAVRAANEKFGRIKNLTPGVVHIDSALANMSVQYKNEEYIGDLLLPMVPTAKLSDRYFKYDKRSRLAYPDDTMGARSTANEINDSRSTDNYSCQDYGLRNYVDVKTLENEDAPLNEMIDLTQAIDEGIAFKREVRQAALLTTAGNFGANTAAIGAGDQWDNEDGGTILQDIQNAIASLWQGRGPTMKVGYCNINTWNAIARNPVIRDLFKFTSGSGLATTKMVAGYFGLEDILVGAARMDTANEGQAEVYSRIWPDAMFGVVRVARRPSLRTASFGYTFRHKGEINTDQWFDPSVGTKGGYWARVSVSDDYKIVANDTGYLITSCIST